MFQFEILCSILYVGTFPKIGNVPTYNLINIQKYKTSETVYVF
jgi:hypothetical protein